MVGTTLKRLLYLGTLSVVVYKGLESGPKRQRREPSSDENAKRYVSIRYGPQLVVLRHEQNLKQLQRIPSIRLEDVINKKAKCKSCSSFG